MKYLQEQTTIKQYLLGRLGAAASEEFEKKVLIDPEYMEAISLVEDELIEDFVANELPDSDKKDFVEHFLSTPHQRQKVELVEAVQTYLASVPTPSSPVTGKRDSSSWSFWGTILGGQRQHALGWRLAATVGVLFIVLTIFLVVRYVRNAPITHSAALQNKLIQLNDSQQRDELLRNYRSVQIVLTGDFVRSGEGMPKISVPAEAEVVQFKFPALRYQSYTASLRTIGGKDIFTLPSVAQIVNGNREPVVNVPVEFLPAGDYELNLSGLTAADDGKPSDSQPYFFRVVR